MKASQVKKRTNSIPKSSSEFNSAKDDVVVHLGLKKKPPSIKGVLPCSWTPHRSTTLRPWHCLWGHTRCSDKKKAACGLSLSLCMLRRPSISRTGDVCSHVMPQHFRQLVYPQLGYGTSRTEHDEHLALLEQAHIIATHFLRYDRFHYHCSSRVIAQGLHDQQINFCGRQKEPIVPHLFMDTFPSQVQEEAASTT